MENGDEWRHKYTRVLGESLHNFVGRQIILLGEVSTVQPNGTSMRLKTTDGKLVTVDLPPDTMDVPQGLVEVRASVVSADTLNLEDLVKFDADPADFDNETYTEAVKLILQGNNAWSHK